MGVTRSSDGTRWECSDLDDHSRADAQAALNFLPAYWRFRQVVRLDPPWWKFWAHTRWVRTREQWNPTNGSDFTVDTY